MKPGSKRTILVAGMGTSPAGVRSAKMAREVSVNTMGLSLRQMCGDVEKVVECLYEKQWELFEKQVSEWPIAFQFYYYMRKRLSPLFRGYQMDGEYNHMTKGFNKEAWKKEIWHDGPAGKKLLPVRPDFIIHRRTTDLKTANNSNLRRNILWVEIKRHDNKQRLDYDFKKLEAVTRSENEDNRGVSGYMFGLSLLLRKRDVRCKWFSAGKVAAIRIGKVSVHDRNIRWDSVPLDEGGDND